MLANEESKMSPFGRIIEALPVRQMVLVTGPITAALEVGRRLARACGLPGAQLMARDDCTWHKDLCHQLKAWPSAPLVVCVAERAPPSAERYFVAVIRAKGFPGDESFAFEIDKAPRAAYPLALPVEAPTESRNSRT